MKKLLKDWDYKKHAKFVSCIYLVLYTLDMTLGYFVVKKTVDKDGNIKPLRLKNGEK